jgi:CBS domain-containing protein
MGKLLSASTRCVGRKFEDQGGNMKVQDVMTSNVKSCCPEANLAAAAGIMWDNNCGTLPVVDGAGRVMGMITDRDIAIAVATKGRLASEIIVAEVVSGRVASCTVDEDIRAALKKMGREKVRRIPVINREGIIQGILSLDDAAVHAEEGKRGQIPDLTYEDVVKTYKAICERPLVAKAAEI